MACVLIGLVILTWYGGGMWLGVHEQAQLNQVWLGMPLKNYGPPTIDPSLQRPVNGIDFAIRSHREIQSTAAD